MPNSVSSVGADGYQCAIRFRITAPFAVFRGTRGFGFAMLSLHPGLLAPRPFRALPTPQPVPISLMGADGCHSAIRFRIAAPFAGLPW